jgi:hypothetical protein
MSIFRIVYSYVHTYTEKTNSLKQREPIMPVRSTKPLHHRMIVHEEEVGNA